MKAFSLRSHLAPGSSFLMVLAMLVVALRSGLAQPTPTDSRPGEAGATNRARLAQSSKSSETNDPIARIRDEGLNHSQVMQTLTHLTEVIGPRLTGSPNLKRANEWTRDKMTSWGLTNAHLEAWGPFGRGWSLKRFSVQVVEPQDIPLIAYPKAWSPSTNGPVST